MWKKVTWLFKRYTRAGKLSEYDTERLLNYRLGLVKAIRREQGHTELLILAKELAKVEHILEERESLEEEPIEGR